MNHSEQINELAAALVAAQGEFDTVSKDSTNPFFKSKYAGLPEVMKTAGPVLAKNKLAVSQFLSHDDSGDTLTTWLIHVSGQYIHDTMKLHLTKDDAQGQGSATTYARRYSYMAVLGLVADEDDDGNAASKPKNKAPVVTVQAPPAPTGGLIHPQLLGRLREALRAAELTGDNATAFVQATVGNPVPRTDAEAQKVIDAIKVLTGEVPF